MYHNQGQTDEILNRFRFRDRDIADTIVNRLSASDLDLVFMHVCGTHQDTLVRYGIDTLLQGCSVEIRQGPGCPVCVTTPMEIVEGVRLAREGITVASFGDMVRVPSPDGSLLDARSDGHDVRIVYSVADAVRAAKVSGRDVVFMAVGFETTAPGTAIEILNGPPENFSILNCHRYVPPAVYALLRMGEIRLDGLIEPGHVSTVIGVRPYEPITRAFDLPQVVAGFEPLDLLMAVYMLVKQVERGEARVENEYVRSVRYEGNLKALGLLDRVFRPEDREWRGFGMIPNSGMALRKEFRAYDARERYDHLLEGLEAESDDEARGCRCGEVLRGVMYPRECPLFARACRPDNPIGPCMVSAEGSCNIEFTHRNIRLS